MKKPILKATVVLLFAAMAAVNGQYKITETANAEITSVKAQQSTGTCWSYATSSFLEAELLRTGQGTVDLSEMYNARMVYENKAMNYVLRQGKANFAQGSLAHDVTDGISKFGLMPQSAYSGLTAGDTVHAHRELAAAAKYFLDGVLKAKKPSKHWPVAFNAILDAYLGEVPESFSYEGKSYTPETFAASLGLKSSDYCHITSFTHHPFYKPFILEIPDNYSNGSFQNVPVDELMEIVDYALKNGYTISWDGDVSEETFSQKHGLAVLPVKVERDEWFMNPTEEIDVTQESRQDNFLNFRTTDDHLMHLVGKAVDQNGTVYYKIKNSWGPVGEYDGFLYMSEAYFKMKVVAVTLHKEAVPKKIVEKFHLKN